jgi:hypothetical protein
VVPEPGAKRQGFIEIVGGVIERDAFVDLKEKRRHVFLAVEIAESGQQRRIAAEIPAHHHKPDIVQHRVARKHPAHLFPDGVKKRHAAKITKHPNRKGRDVSTKNKGRLFGRNA